VTSDITAKESSPHATAVSKGSLWSGRILGALSTLFLLTDGVMKLIKPAPVVEATVRLGYPESVIQSLGIVLVACTILYAIPRTSILGAILLTGYLGGAVAANVRVGNPLFSHTLFPVYVALLVWGGLYLRDRRLRGLIPVRDLERFS
jgi:DoxX-like family